MHAISQSGRMTGGQALAGQLFNEGVRQIFGVPGIQLDHAVDALAQVADHIAYWNTRHEQAASYMADGYARATGDVGVCMVVPGPGMLNALAGLATAYACSSRVLCIVGQLPSHAIGKGYGLLHEIPNQSGILASLTKWHARASSPAEIPDLIREAFWQLHAGRPRPVAIEVPVDVLAASAEVRLHQESAPAAPLHLDPGQIRAAADLLRAATRPAIYAGGGVLASDATGRLHALAERLGAPVVTSVNGRGAMSSRHPLTLNSLAGREILSAADVVVAVGSRFMTEDGVPVTTAPDARVILLNADRADLGPPRQPAVAIHADAHLGLAALTDELDSLPATRQPWADLDAVRARAEAQLRQLEPQWSWVQALRAAIPDDGVLVNELTQVGHFAEVAYPVYQPRTYVSPGYQGTLGYGFPTALGVKAARPDTPVVSITGDGGFGWSLQELATARKYGIGLVTVVFDDGAYGNVRRTQREQFGGRTLGTDLVNPDYVRLAEAFSVRGLRASSPAELTGVLREALAAPAEPVVISVPVGPMPDPWHLLRE